MNEDKAEISELALLRPTSQSGDPCPEKDCGCDDCNFDYDLSRKRERGESGDSLATDCGSGGGSRRRRGRGG
jgi:hypothetical protein